MPLSHRPKSLCASLGVSTDTRPCAAETVAVMGGIAHPHPTNTLSDTTPEGLHTYLGS